MPRVSLTPRSCAVLLCLFHFSVGLASGHAEELEIALKTEALSKAGFEGAEPLAQFRFQSSTGDLVKEGASEGAQALRLRFDPASAYPSVQFVPKTPEDYRGYGGLAFDVTNPSEATVSFAVRIDSSENADGSGNHSRTGRGTIDGRQTETFLLPFGVDPAALKMIGLPGFEGFRNLGSHGSGPFDLGHITSWQIFLNRPHAPQELIVDNFRLIPGRRLDFDKLVDRYGQFTRQEWPGKIHSDRDFQTQLQAEDEDLKAHPPLPDRNRFGGWEQGPKLEATGFFRTEKYQGKWALVDPEGRLFLSFGPTTVTASAPTPLEGRESMYEVLPANDPALAASTDEKGVNFLEANLRRKYGEEFLPKWYDRTYDRLLSWGFNTIAAFSSWDTIKNGRVPYTSTVWVGGKHARIPSVKPGIRPFSDPYDPAFETDMEAAVRGQAAQAGNDPFLIGYFVGNEEDWGHFRSGPRAHYGLIFSALKLRASESPAKRAFLRLLKERHGDIGNLNAAWNQSFPHWEALDEPVSIKDPLSPGLLADFSMLLTDLGEEYFKKVSQAIRNVDPNRLYLGCRFAGYSPEIMKAAAKYSDVLSFNVYRLTIDSNEWQILDHYDKPFLIGEFHFGAPDRGMFNEGLVPVENQSARARAYQEYLRSVLAHPKCVGAHWFQYTDQPTIGRPGDGENGNVGFVSITDTPFPELIEAARTIHAEMYPLRFGK